MNYSRLLYTAVLFGGMLLVGCESGDNKPQTAAERISERADTRDKALVRFVNALPGSSSTDAFLDSLRTFEGVSFKTITPYREVPDGRHVVGLGAPAVQAGSRDLEDRARDMGDRVTGQDRDADRRNVPEESQSFAGGSFYTVIAHPDEDNGQPKITIIKDDVTDNPPRDKARVRVIDASRQVGDIDVFAEGRREALMEDVGALDGSYKEIDPVTGSLQIRPQGKQNTLATVAGMNLEAGKSYTIIVTGSGSDPKRLDAIAVEDHLASRGSARERVGQGSGYDRDNARTDDKDDSND